MSMRFSRIRLSTEADARLKMMKARTGLLPNILCRIALLASLAEDTAPDARAFADEGGREMNRVTLFGHWDTLFSCLVEQRCWELLGSTDDAERQLVGHINRGIGMLATQARSLGDLLSVLPDGEGGLHATSRLP